VGRTPSSARDPLVALPTLFTLPPHVGQVFNLLADFQSAC